MIFWQTWDKTAQTAGQSSVPVVASGPFQGDTCNASWWNPTTEAMLANNGLSGLRCFFFCYASGNKVTSMNK